MKKVAEISDDLIIETDFRYFVIRDFIMDNILLALNPVEFESLCRAISKYRKMRSQYNYKQSTKGKAAMHEVYMRRKLKGLTQKGE
jgi:hypothetical protein